MKWAICEAVYRWSWLYYVNWCYFPIVDVYRFSGLFFTSSCRPVFFNRFLTIVIFQKCDWTAPLASSCFCHRHPMALQFGNWTARKLNKPTVRICSRRTVSGSRWFDKRSFVSYTGRSNAGGIQPAAAPILVFLRRLGTFGSNRNAFHPLSRWFYRHCILRSKRHRLLINW